MASNSYPCDSDGDIARLKSFTSGHVIGGATEGIPPCPRHASNQDRVRRHGLGSTDWDEGDGSELGPAGLACATTPVHSTATNVQTTGAWEVSGTVTRRLAQECGSCCRAKRWEFLFMAVRMNASDSQPPNPTSKLSSLFIKRFVRCHQVLNHLYISVRIHLLGFCRLRSLLDHRSKVPMENPTMAEQTHVDSFKTPDITKLIMDRSGQTGTRLKTPVAKRRMTVNHGKITDYCLKIRGYHAAIHLPKPFHHLGRSMASNISSLSLHLVRIYAVTCSSRSLFHESDYRFSYSSFHIHPWLSRTTPSFFEPFLLPCTALRGSILSCRHLDSASGPQKQT